MDNPSFSNVYVLTSLFFDSKGNIASRNVGVTLDRSAARPRACSPRSVSVRGPCGAAVREPSRSPRASSGRLHQGEVRPDES